jgi:hypothetical protein
MSKQARTGSNVVPRLDERARDHDAIDTTDADAAH